MEESNSILLSVIIPCFNKESLLNEVVDRVISSPVLNKEIIIVDDCSSDRTRDVIESKLKGKVNKIIYHDKNMGKGAALRSGFKEVSGDIVIIQDADLEYNPQDYPILIKPIIDRRADVVYGSRFVGAQAHRVLYFWHRLGNRILTFVSNMFTNFNLTDMETGYKVFKKEVIDKITIEEDRFGFEPEITAKIAKLKCRVYEVGISYSGRTYQEGKKITWIDAVDTFRCIIKYNLFF